MSNKKIFWIDFVIFFMSGDLLLQNTLTNVDAIKIPA
jgi:hypothetical protein